MKIRRPRRDMSRPQAPVPHYELGWMHRWGIERMRRDIQNSGLRFPASIGMMFKTMYGQDIASAARGLPLLSIVEVVYR